MTSPNRRTPLTELAARHGAAILAGAGALLLLLAGWRLAPADALTARITTLPRAAANGRPTLLVVFQPGDCQSYGRFLSQWNALAAEGEVRVVGVPLYAQAQRAAGKPVLDYFTPVFPLRDELAADATSLLRQMGQMNTPVAVLLDGAGRPRMVIPPGRYPREHVQARMAVRDYARAMFPLPRTRKHP
jgi:hypothetical protein